MSSDNHITVRDWRRRPPLPLRVTKKLDIHGCWIKCTRCPHMRAVAIAPYIIRWGPDGWRDMNIADGLHVVGEIGRPWI